MLETEAFVVLTSIPYLGSNKIRFLINKFGSALQALQASSSQIQKLPGFDRVTPHWDQWPQQESWKKDLAQAAKLKIELLPFTSAHFPKALLAIPDPPIMLYIQGELRPQDQRAIAIIGTRHASIYGSEMAEQISNDLAAHGFTVISGLARGIDTAAHHGALKKGRTIAIIGSGLADIYPSENRFLSQEISKKGAVISEFSMRTPPDRQNFPQRNRIVSGMSLATVLIEAPIKSGAMITMEKAHTQTRKLFALPGRADNENFRGNHYLIKSGKAQLIENASDIISHFEELFPFPSLKVSISEKTYLDKNETLLLEKMTEEEVGIETLAHLTHFPINQLHPILMGLVLKKVIKEFPGKIYKKIKGK